MKLIEFSVSNYRSITTAHKIKLQSLTVLVGKNNEGKSNLLRALNVAMSAVVTHSRQLGFISRSRRQVQYDWKKDFPIQHQSRHSGLDSIFKLNFRLEGTELNDFHYKTGIRGNEDIPIVVKIGKDNNPRITVPKKGSSSYNKKSQEVTQFISTRISINYIQAVRTEDMAIDALQDTIWNELRQLDENPSYVKAQKEVSQLQQNALDKISAQLKEPLKTFLPNLQNVSIQQSSDGHMPYFYGNNIDVIIDDGIPTSIKNKGDGIKSLITLAILKNRRSFVGASVIAIEEPESHLHSGAIHSLIDVIYKMSENSQVIITTHNPLFVQQNKINSNIIVDMGTARPAKTISEIRSVLGVLPSDNLKNARYVLLVEGEDDRIALSKLLPVYSDTIKQALSSNSIVIKSLGGAGNLAHDAADLKNCMCKFVVLLDNDRAGQEAAQKAISNGVLKENEVKYTICNGSPEAEFEDCLQPNVYDKAIMEEFSVNINVTEFRGNKKWSERLKQTFLSQGSRWTDATEKKAKLIVANCISENLNLNNMDDTIITQKAGFLSGLVSIVEEMITVEK